MSVDNYLRKIAPYTNITHMARGILDEAEVGNFSEKIIKIRCRELYCGMEDTTTLEFFFEQPYMACFYCGSYNVTIEWIDFNQLLGQIVLPNTEAEGFPVDSYTDPYYSYIYHRHFQREI